MLESWILSREKSKHWRWDMAAGVVVGFATSLISITFVMFLQRLKSSIFSAAKSLLRAFLRLPFTRTCFLVVYFSVMAWLVVQYGKRIGLSEIFTVFNS